MRISASIQRLLEQESEPFHTKNVEVEDFTPPEGGNAPRENWIDVGNVDSTVIWTLDTLYSPWGVSDLRPRIQSITCWWDENSYTEDGDDGPTQRRTFRWTREMGEPGKADTAFDLEGALAGRAADTSFPLEVRAIFHDRNRDSERDYLTISPMGMELNLQQATAVIRFS